MQMAFYVIVALDQAVAICLTYLNNFLVRFFAYHCASIQEDLSMGAISMLHVLSDKFNIRYQGKVYQSTLKNILPIRHFDFKFDPKKFDERFFLNKELASSYFEALSIFLTFGEDVVISTARYHRDFVKDPTLKLRLTSLIGQEAIHSKVHNQFNDEVLKENNFPVEFLRYLADKVFEYGILKLPQPVQLSLMAGIEHYTAVLAEFMMQHEEYFFASQDEKQRAMWMWHMLEESEHKDIAYDVFLELSGNYWLRIVGFLLATLTILGGVSLGGYLIPFIRKPSNLINPKYMKDMIESTALLFGSERGVFGSSAMHILEYFKPSFHPNDHDTSEYLAYYKEKLLNPENGLLTPYLTKEFMPQMPKASA